MSSDIAMLIYAKATKVSPPPCDPRLKVVGLTGYWIRPVGIK